MKTYRDRRAWLAAGEAMGLEGRMLTPESDLGVSAVPGDEVLVNAERRTVNGMWGRGPWVDGRNLSDEEYWRLKTPEDENESGMICEDEEERAFFFDSILGTPSVTNPEDLMHDLRNLLYGGADEVPVDRVAEVEELAEAVESATSVREFRARADAILLKYGSHSDIITHDDTLEALVNDILRSHRALSRTWVGGELIED